MPEQSNSTISIVDSSRPTATQQQLARDLQLNSVLESDVETLVSAIDEALGNDALRQRAYWFLLSVWRDRQGECWTHPDEVALNEDHLENALQRFLERKDACLSLGKLLADKRTRYCMMDFGSKRDIGQRRLARSNKAYQVAIAALSEASANSVPRGIDDANDTAAIGTSASIVDRRAARRVAAQVSAVAAAITDGSDDWPRSLARPVSDLSEEEYQEMQNALDSESPVDPALIGSNSKRLNEKASLALGILAGLAFFVLLSWLLL